MFLNRRGPVPDIGLSGRVRTVRRECLDRVLIYHTRHLLAVLGGHLAHDNGHRAHQGRGQRPPDRDTLPAPVADRSAVWGTA
jgi:hypothetical protein